MCFWDSFLKQNSSYDKTFYSLAYQQRAGNVMIGQRCATIVMRAHYVTEMRGWSLITETRRDCSFAGSETVEHLQDVIVPENSPCELDVMYDLMLGFEQSMENDPSWKSHFGFAQRILSEKKHYQRLVEDTFQRGWFSHVCLKVSTLF